MKKDKKSEAAANLRLKSEALLRKKVPEKKHPISEAEQLKLIHELEVHQVELEMQNEELIHARSAAMESAEKYRVLYDIAPSGYISLTRKGDIAELNVSGSQMLGKEREHLIGSRFHFFVSDNSKPAFNYFLAKLFTSKVKETCEVSLSVPGNKPVHVLLSGVILPGGKECLLTLHDITAKRDELDLLHLHESRYLFALKHTPVSLAIQDQDLKFTWAYNQKTIDPVDVIDKSDDDIFAPKDAAHLKKLKRRVLEKGIEVHEQLWINSNGKRVFIDLYLEPIHDEKGRVTGLGIATLDLTELKRAEMALKETRMTLDKSEHIISNFLDIVPVGIIRWDADGKIYKVNDRFLEITGYSNEDIREKQISWIQHSPEYSERDKEATKEYLSTGKCNPYEKIIIRGDGSVVHVLISTVGVDPENKSGIAFLMDVTELKNKEEALHKSEQRLRFHLENSPLAVVEWNSDLFVTQWSSEAERIFGWKKEETLNRHIGTLNVIYPEDIPIVDQTITRLTSGQDLTVVASNRNVTKAGKIIECIWHNSVLLDEKGQMKSVMSLVEDITERKKAEVALRESEERFRALAENIPDLIVRFDRDLRLVYSNPAALKRTGFSMGKVVGHKARTGDAPVVIAEWEKAAREVLDIGISRRTEFTTQYLGETRVFDVQIIPEKDAEGAVRSIVAFGRDITERKKMEESLQESEEKFRKMIWDMEVGVLLQGPKAEILVSNPKALDLLGLTENQLMGKTSFDPDWNVIHEDGSSFPGSTHPVPLSIATRLPVRDVVMGVYRPAKRDRAWLVVSAEPQLNADGTIRQVVCTFVDITRLKQAEDELKHLNEVLEDRIKMRTSELVKANTALQQAEAKYRTVADYAYNWEYWINPEGTYNYVSPSCERITGYSAQEFMDDKNLIYKIVHPDDLGNFTDRVAQQLHSNEPCEMEFRIVSKTGDIRWIGHSRRNIYDDRKYLGIRVSNLDITEKVKAENELLNVTVEVEERERNRFSRELHDGLGPLLSTVKLYFQWLAETDDVDKIKIITEKGNFNIDQAIQTTREVAHGLSPLILNNFGYIEAVLGFIHSINETQKINIYFIFNSSERFGIQVETILYRITTELVNNTLKHAKATYAKILFRKQEEKNVITFTYSDNGIGFDPQEVEKTGKGLGLNNIKNRIKTLMGIMSIETIMGEGMKVQIELPVHESFN